MKFYLISKDSIETRIKNALETWQVDDIELAAEIARRYPEATFERHTWKDNVKIGMTVYKSSEILIAEEHDINVFTRNDSF